MNMGEIIKQERLAKGLTMEQLANKLGVGKSAVNKWEKGTVENIKRPTIKKMAEIFGCSPAYLMGYETFETAEEFEKKWNDITNGQHPIELSDEEYRLIVNYRVCSEETKEMISRMVLYGTEIRKGGNQ